MATTRQPNDPQRSINETQEDTPKNDIEEQQTPEGRKIGVFDYSKRAPWLRAAVLGANDGLLSTSSLMMGVGAVRTDVKSMILSGIAGLVGGACSMAIGEFVSVYTQYDIEVAQMKRENSVTQIQLEDNKDLPNPLQAAAASASAFAAGAALPLLGAAFIKDYHVRLGVVVGVVTFALPGFGSFGAYLGGTPVMKSSLRLLIGGWLALGITFGLTKLIGSTGL